MSLLLGRLFCSIISSGIVVLFSLLCLGIVGCLGISLCGLSLFLLFELSPVDYGEPWPPACIACSSFSLPMNLHGSLSNVVIVYHLIFSGL